MLSIKPLFPDEIDALRALATRTWQSVYPALIPQAQIDAMLADRYAADRIRRQLEDPEHVWRLARIDATPVGFAHASFAAAECKLDKLYVDPAFQRQGVGGALLAHIKSLARDRAATRLWLQVNRGNAQAIAAYRRFGFSIERAQVFDIGGGFIMDDYVMEMPL